MPVADFFWTRRARTLVDKGRPGFKEEYQRGMTAIAEHERRWRSEHPEADESDPLAAWAIQEYVVPER
jgi:hypothetical protein